MTSPNTPRSSEYLLYKRHGIWPIAQTVGWQAEIISPDGDLVHTTTISATKAEAIAEAKHWLDIDQIAQ